MPKMVFQFISSLSGGIQLNMPGYICIDHNHLKLIDNVNLKKFNFSIILSLTLMQLVRAAALGGLRSAVVRFRAIPETFFGVIV